MNDRLLKGPEVDKTLNIHRNTRRRLIEKGALEPVEIAGMRFFRQSDVERLMEAGWKAGDLASDPNVGIKI